MQVSFTIDDKELIAKYSGMLDELSLSGAISEEEMDVFEKVQALLERYNK